MGHLTFKDYMNQNPKTKEEKYWCPQCLDRLNSDGSITIMGGKAELIYVEPQVTLNVSKDGEKNHLRLRIAGYEVFLCDIKNTPEFFG